MKRYLLFLLVLVIFGTLALAPMLAQDATPEVTQAAGTEGTGTVNCDADLMLNLYIADRFFGFGAVQTQLMQGGVANAVDTSVFDTGQFGTLFGTARAMQDPTTGMMTNSGWTQEQITGLSGTLSQDDTTFDEAWTTTFGGDAAAADATQLTTAAVADEAPECAQLRTALYRFWRAVALQDFTGGMTGSFSSGTGTTDDLGGTEEATPEATASG